MAQKTLTVRQKQKYDTATNWTTNNPVLLAGEIGVESDTNKFKIGDGTTAWNSLAYGKGSLPSNVTYYIEQQSTPSASLPYYTKAEIDAMIGNINTLLSEI